jgi:putative ABC transport system ATP-binding protein
MTAPDPVVLVEHLHRTYETPGGTVHAVRDVSVTLPRGRVVALAGRSGSGKTTLLNCIGGLDVPTSGRVVVDGVDLTGLDEGRRTALRQDRIAFVFQTFGLLPMLSAAENVGLPLRIRRRDRRERERRVAELLEQVGLTDHAGQRPDELSGGQQQRVAIARALAVDPVLLIADEPTGQLDAESSAEIVALLRSLVADGRRTVLLSTHDPLVQGAADEVIRLADGRLLPSAPVPTP